MKIHHLLIPCAAALAIAASAAEPFNIRPGLWKMSTTLTTGGAPLYIQGMPEAGRAEYARSWARDVGKPATDQEDECVTEKDIRRDLLKDLRDQTKSCKEVIARQTASALVATVECKDANSTTRTEIDYSAESPTSLKGTLKSTIQSPNGTTTMHIALAGKWVAASCPADLVEEEAESEEEEE